MLVIDASVAVKWFANEANTAAALDLLDRPVKLVAPDLVVAEVANVLWKHLVRGELQREQVAHVPRALPRVFSELRPLADLAPRAFEIAMDLGHPVYDCFYLALAEAEGASMVTADRRLILKLRGTGWAGMCRPLVAT